MQTTVKSDLSVLADGSLTASDVNALVQSNVKLIQLLEQINNNLEPLKDIKTEVSGVKEYVKEDLVEEVVRRAIVEKQLDITNEQSKLAASLKENTSLLKAVADKLNKAIWVLILCVTLLGGVRVVTDYILPNKKSAQQTTTHYSLDSYGRAFITDATGDTLWLSTVPPTSNR